MGNGKNTDLRHMVSKDEKFFFSRFEISGNFTGAAIFFFELGSQTKSSPKRKDCEVLYLS